MTNTETVTVIQEDRDTAANVWRDFVARPGEIMAERAIRTGALDDGELVQTFARHRASTPAGEVLPEEPSDAVIRAVDKACHEHWPNARKMAIGMYKAIRLASLTAKPAAEDRA